MRRTLTALAALALLLAGACGDGENDDSAGASASASVAARGEGDGSDFCGKAKVIAEDESLAAAGDTPEETKEAARESLAALDDLAEGAPEEIDDDLDTVIAGLRPLLEALAEGTDLANLPPEEQEKFQALESDDYQAAVTRVNAYLETECEIDTDDDGDTDGETESTAPGDDTTDDTTATTAGE